MLDLEGDRSLSVSFLKSDNPQLQTIRNIARSNPDKSLYSGSKLQKMQVMAAKNLSQFDVSLLFISASIGTDYRIYAEITLALSPF